MIPLSDKNFGGKHETGQIKKFMFDCVFQTDEQKALEVNYKHTSEDFLQAQKISYEQGEQTGYKRGHEEALSSIYKQCADKVTYYLKLLLEQHSDFEKKSHQSVALMTSYMARTLLPAYMEQGALAEVINVIEQAFETLEKSTVVIYVHPKMVEILDNETKKFQEENPLIILKIQAVRSGCDLSDCRIEWQGGGLERRSKRLEEEVQIALSRLASHKNESQEFLKENSTVQDENLMSNEIFEEIKQ